MPQIINTNIASLTAQRNLNSSQSANQTSLERLSSGLRINSAKDDAAGLAISTRFSSQIRGLSVAIRNAGDGISLAQTAEGALGSISDALQRLRELALQSSNATNSDVDREALNAEAQQLISEITRTGEQTDFNGTNLLDGNFAASFQVGANAGETVSFGIAELTASNLGGGRTAGVSAIGSSAGLANGDLVINGAVVGPSVASDDTSSFANAPASAISKVAAINRASDESGVKAEVLTNIAAGSVQNEATGGAGATTGTITLNGVEIAVATGDVDESADRSGIVAAINARSGETGVTAVDTGTRFGGVNLEAADGRNITLEFTSGNLSSASTGLTSQETTSGGYTLSATTSGTAIVISESTGDISNSGLVAGTYTANTSAVSTSVRTSEDGAPIDPLDTAAVAASVTSTGSGTLGDYTGANALEFDITISDAVTSGENGTVSVSVSENLTGDTVQDLADAINASVGDSLAVTASVDSDGNLQISRDTAEAGTLTVSNFGTNGSTDAAAVADALGIASGASGEGADVISADTVIAAVAASTTGGSAVDTSVLGGTVLDASNRISFDISISDAASQAAQTVSVEVGSGSSINSLSTGQELVDAINTAITNASATIGVTASLDADNQIVFTRDTAESGVLEISNVGGTGAVSDANAADVLGYSLDDADGNGTVSSNGADATTVGEQNLRAVYYTSGNSFTAGAASSSTVAFETGSASSAVLSTGAGLNTTSGSTGVSLVDAGAIEFELSLDNGESVTISTAASSGVTDATQSQLQSAIETAIDSALGAGEVLVSFVDNELTLTTGPQGSQKSLEITSVTGNAGADALGLDSALGVVATGAGGTETALITLSEGTTPDFGFDFNSTVTSFATGDAGNLVDRDNLSFDISLNNDGTITNDTITLDTDSSPRGATLVVAIDNNEIDGAGDEIDGTGTFGAIAANDISFTLEYNGVSATFTNTGGGITTGAALVADLQSTIDTNFAAADGFGTGAAAYTAGDVQVSIDDQDRIVITTRSTDGSETLGISATAGANNATVASIVTGEGAAYTAGVTGNITSSTYQGDAAASALSTGGAVDETVDFDGAGENVTFSVSYTADGVTTTGNATLATANAGTLDGLVDDVQAAIDAALGTADLVIVSYDTVGDNLRYTSADTGSDVSFTLSDFASETGASLAAIGVAAADTITGTGSDFDADAAFLNDLNTKIQASSLGTDVVASIDQDSNLVFQSDAAGENIELTVGNFVGNSDALASLGVTGTERAFGPEITVTGLSATAGDARGYGLTGVDLSGAAGDGFDFNISYNGGIAVNVTDAGGLAADATANELVSELQTQIDAAFVAAAAADTLGGGVSEYSRGDILVSINSAGELVFTNTNTDANASLEITDNAAETSDLEIGDSGVVTATNFSDSGPQASIKEATGTAPATFNFDFSTNSVSFDLSFDDGSGAAAVTGTVVIDTAAANTRDAFVALIQDDLNQVLDTDNDIEVSVDSDGFLVFTAGNSNVGSGVSFTIDNFQDATGTGGLEALGLGDGNATPYAALSFTATGTDSNITTNVAGTSETDIGRDQPDQNDTLTISGLQGGDETITLEGSFTDREGIVDELNSKLTNATATLSDSGVITITDNDVSQDSEGNTVAVTGNAAADLGFDGNGSASAGVINTQAGADGNETQTIRSLLDGDLRINGVSIAASRTSDDTASNELANSSNKAASGIAIAAAINRSTETTGVSASVNATVVSGGTANTDRVADGDAGEVYINGISAGVINLGADKETNRANAISAINQIAGQTGVLATDNGGGITLTAADGRNVSVAIDTLGTNFTGQNIGLDASVRGIAEADFAGEGVTFADVAATTSSTIRLSSSSEFTVSAGTNGAVGEDGFGGLEGLGIKAGTYGGAESGQFLNEIDISTVDGALSALDALDNALSSVSSERANLGAIQNRLQSTIDNLSISVENLQAANSRILDADFAAETAELSRTQVLQQAGISILAQANAAPQQVLSLLQ